MKVPQRDDDLRLGSVASLLDVPNKMRDQHQTGTPLSSRKEAQTSISLRIWTGNNLLAGNLGSGNELWPLFSSSCDVASSSSSTSVLFFGREDFPTVGGAGSITIAIIISQISLPGC